MKDRHQSPPPVEYQADPQYFLRIESGNGDTDSIPYVQLGLIQCRAGSKKDSKKITLHFSIGIVEIEAINSDHLLRMFEEEKVSLIRKGLAEDESQTSILSVKYAAKTQFVS